jgi:hypothetical protein
MLLSATCPPRAACSTTATSSTRAQLALPILLFDRDPYMVVTDSANAEVDPRRVHVDHALPVRASGSRRHDLHAQQREGRDRCLPRQHHRVRRRLPTTRWSNRVRPHLPGHLQAGQRRCRTTCAAHPLPRGPVPGADGRVRHLSHGRPRAVLPSRGPVADPHVWRRRTAPDPFMRHIIMRLPESRGRVHLHGAVHTARQGQPGGVDGRAERR